MAAWVLSFTGWKMAMAVGVTTYVMLSGLDGCASNAVLCFITRTLSHVTLRFQMRHCLFSPGSP